MSGNDHQSAGFLPSEYEVAHELCFVIHDVLTQFLVSGEKHGVFFTSIQFKNDSDRSALEESGGIFEWLEETRRVDERADLLATTVLPAALSDMLHCIYEALTNSRKAKLAVTYMLLRKPLQETLYLFESMVVDRKEFADKLISDPMKLRGLKAGGLEAHTRRVQKALSVIGDDFGLDSTYIAQLRYDKASADSFDGVCNHAMHLFTEHKAIRTEDMNINFIFSDIDSKKSQWAFLYSRLPYLLFYTHQIVESVATDLAPTCPAYLEDINRRIAALVVLWWPTVRAPYDASQLEALAKNRHRWLDRRYQDSGVSSPEVEDLWHTARTGELSHKIRGQ